MIFFQLSNIVLQQNKKLTQGKKKKNILNNLLHMHYA